MSITASTRHVLERARVARVTERIAHVDFVRAVVEAAAGGASQTEIARELHVSQPAVSQLLASAVRSVGVVPEGFSGSTPYEIAQRYAAGRISREQVIDELARWPYRSGKPSDGVDWLTFEPGEWNEQVVPALDGGLLDDETYDAIQDRISAAT